MLVKTKLEGFGWFAFETLHRICKNHPEHEFIFFFDRSFDTSFVFAENVTPVRLFPRTGRPLLFDWWFNRSVARALKEYRADVFVSPDGYLSLTTNVPQLAVIHDLNFEHYPEDLPRWASRYYKSRFPRFAEKATRILTVSEYSKQDIVKTYGISPQKIDVAYNGVNPAFAPISVEKQREVKQELTSGKDFFLFVGAQSPRKNLARLFSAFEQFKADGGEAKLLVVGEKYWWDKATQEAYNENRFQQEILFTGHLQLHRLARVTASALALTYVSYFEGFGIPLVEAMRSGTPVIAAKATSLPEVGEDAVLYCDPFDVNSISARLTEVEKNESLRQGLIEKGLRRAEYFSWEKTAKIMWNSIEKTVSC